MTGRILLRQRFCWIMPALDSADNAVQSLTTARWRRPMASNEPITSDYVRSILDYDPETGGFRWREREDVSAQWNGKHAGTRAGCVHNNGYIQISLNDRLYNAHRLAWLITTDSWPRQQIDHIDRDRSNNRIANLRQATRSENQHNRGAASNNTSGKKGVVYDARRNHWVARIAVSGRQVHLGLFANLDDAAAAYADAARRLHGEFARLA